MFLSRIPILSRCLLKGWSSWNPKAPVGATWMRSNS